MCWIPIRKPLLSSIDDVISSLLALRSGGPHRYRCNMYLLWPRLYWWCFRSKLDSVDCRCVIYGSARGLFLNSVVGPNARVFVHALNLVCQWSLRNAAEVDTRKADISVSFCWNWNQIQITPPQDGVSLSDPKRTSVYTSTGSWRTHW